MSDRGDGIDLHTHSCCSDGALEPAALVERAGAHGVTTLALTDHDTIDGLAEAAAACREHDMTLVSGVEISVTWRRRTLHIVGLAFDPEAPALTTGLAELQDRRRERAARIAYKLEQHGEVDVDERAAALAGRGHIGRAHFARLLVDSGRCKNLQQAFKLFLKPGRPAYVATEWAGLEQAIGWIHAAGGLAVLAHPLGYGFSGAWRRRMVAEFAATGGDAIEVCTGNANPEYIRTAAHHATRHQLMGSLGTDFHSPKQHWLRLGRTKPLPASIAPVWQDSRFRG